MRLAYLGIAETLPPAPADGGAARGVRSEAPCTQAAWPSSWSNCALSLQVVALRLRSSGRVGQAPLPEEQELDYAAKLNRALPPDIKVLGWTTVPEGFSARWGWTARHSSQLLAWSSGPGQRRGGNRSLPAQLSHASAAAHIHAQPLQVHGRLDAQELLCRRSAPASQGIADTDVTVLTCRAVQVLHPAP